MTFRALILDDEPLAVSVLRQQAERTGMANIVGSAGDAASGLALLAAQPADVLFLDISMPGMSGIELARHLRSLSNAPLVILVTAYDHFGTEAFDCAVVDYVLKPVEPERLLRACQRAQQLLAARSPVPERPDDWWLPHRGTVVRVALADIERLEADRDYVHVHLAERSYLMRSTLAALESRLDPSAFVRIHRSTILRADQISELRHLGAGTWLAVDERGATYRVGRSYLDAVRARLVTLVAS
jgi:two-component system response regulator AlgR